MSEETNAARSRRLNQVIAAYLEKMGSGDAPDRDALLDEHPDLADDLTLFFAAQENVESAADRPTLPWRPSDTDAASVGATIPPGLQGAGQGPTMPNDPVQGVPPVGARVRYFGDYALVEEIARGGMGVVYKARQMSLNRIVALKMILSGNLAGEDDVKRFHAEAEAAADLDHPGIVPIHEVGQHEGQHYFSMGFIDGSSLSDKITDGPLTTREAARLVKSVAEAVQYAHEKGVIHRDLKPSNILLDEKGLPRVTDFGLAKRVSGGSDLTNTGQVLGTPSYMPPEQAAGKLDQIGPAADVYALGAILYTLITGRPPFQAPTPIDTLMQVLEQVPVSPRVLYPRIQRDLETITLKCLEKESQRRYASARELADELGRYLDGEPIRARPISAPERAWRWYKRKPLVASLSGALIAAVLGGLVGVTTQWIRAEYQADRARKQEGIAQKERDEARRARDREAAARREAEEAQLAEFAARQTADQLAEQRRQRLYASEIQLAQQAYENANVDHALELLLHHLPQSEERDLRGFEWYYLWRLCHAERQTLHLVDDARALAFSPDGKLLATSGAGMDAVTLWDVATGRPQSTIHGVVQRINTLAFSPDGTMLAVGGWFGAQPTQSSASAALVELQTGRIVFRFAGLERDLERADSVKPNPAASVPGPSPQSVTALAFTGDGRTIAMAVTKFYEQGGVPATRYGYVATLQAQREIGLWDVSTGSRQAPLEGKTFGALSLAFSPDGNLLSAGCWDGTVRIWDRADGRLIKTLDRHLEYVWAVTFSPDGRWLASGSGKWDGLPEILVWEVPEFRVHQQLYGHSTGVRALAFADGRILASGGWDRRVKLWDVEKGLELRSLIGHRSHVRSLSFSPDGQLLASGSSDRTARVWYVHEALDHVVFRGPEACCYGLSFSPDDQRLAVSSPDSRVIDLNRGVTVAEYAVAGGDALVVYSPDGKLLATASTSPVITLRDAASGEVLHEWKAHDRKIWSLEFSPDSCLLASGSQDNTLGVWDTSTAREVRRLKGSGNTIRALAFSPDGALLAACCHRPARYRSSELRVWQVDTGKTVVVVSAKDGFHSGWGEDLAFTPDGHLLATGGHDGTVKLWNTRSWQLQRSLKGHQDVIYGLTVAPDGRTLATASWDTTVKLWNINTGLLLLTLRGQCGVAYSVAFSHDNQILAAGSAHIARGAPSMRQTQLFFAASQDEAQATATGRDKPPSTAVFEGSSRLVRSIDWSRDGKRVACGDSTGSIAVYNRLTGDTVLELQAHSKTAFVKFLNDGDDLVTAGMDGKLAVRNTQTGEVTVELEGHEGAIRAVAVSADGRTIATGGEKKWVALWDARSGTRRQEIRGEFGVISGLAFAPNGRSLAGCSWDRQVYLWDLASGARRHVLQGASAGLVAVTFSRDGRLLAAGGGYGDPAIHIWDSESGKHVAALSGHCGEVQGLSFDREGRGLWSAAWDRSLRLWNTRTWEETGVWYVSDRPVYALALSYNGEIATGGEDNACRVWDVATLFKGARPLAGPAQPQFGRREVPGALRDTTE